MNSDFLSAERKRREEYLKSVENKQYRHAEKVWHRLYQGTYIGDAVYGANDGIITTFAVVAGAAGAALSPVVIIILGIANLLADGFSMGASNFLSRTSQRDFNKAQRAREEWEVEQFPEIEREEVREIVRRWGIGEDKIGKERLEDLVDKITSDKTRWVDLMMREELDIIEDDGTSAFKHGIVTLVSFVTAGSLPLIPYVFGFGREFQLPVSITTTVLSLFFVGASRTLVTQAYWWKSGLEMLFVGGIAASAAYVLGGFVKSLFGIII